MTMQKSFARMGIILMIAFGLLFAANAILGQSVLAQDTTAACRGVEITGGSCDGAGESTLTGIITAVVDILSIVVGALSVIMIIIGGLRYITSGGDSAGTASAKNTIIYAVVGLVIVIFAQVIVNFVIDRSTNPAGTGEATPADDGGGAPDGG